MSISKDAKRAYDKARYEARDKEASRIAARARYEKNKAHRVEYANNWNKRKLAEMRRIYDEAKNAPCTDCKIQYPPYVMDLDHLPQFKKHEAVSSMVTNYRSSPKKLLEEISKCELVCANCHRIRTHNRKDCSNDAL